MAIYTDYNAIQRRPLNRLLASFGAAASIVLAGCATAPKPLSTEVQVFLGTLDRTLIGADGKPDPLVVAAAFRTHMKAKDPAISESIQKVLQNHQITMQTAKEIADDNQAEADRIANQGYEVLVKALDDRARLRFPTSAAGLVLAKFDTAVARGDKPQAFAVAQELVGAYRVAPELDKARIDAHLKAKVKAIALPQQQREIYMITLHMVENADKVWCPRVNAQGEVVADSAKRPVTKGGASIKENIPFTTTIAAHAACAPGQ